MPDLERPKDMGHIHEELTVPNRGVIPAPEPDPPPKPVVKKSKVNGGADEAPPVVEEA